MPGKDAAAWATAASAIEAQAAELGVPVGPMAPQPDSRRNWQLLRRVGERRLGESTVTAEVSCELELSERIFVAQLVGLPIFKEGVVVAIAPTVIWVQRGHTLLFRCWGNASVPLELGMTLDILNLTGSGLPITLPTVDFAMVEPRSWSLDFMTSAPFDHSHEAAIAALFHQQVDPIVDAALPTTTPKWWDDSQFLPRILFPEDSPQPWLLFTRAGAVDWDSDRNWLVLPIALSAPIADRLP